MLHCRHLLNLLLAWHQDPSMHFCLDAVAVRKAFNTRISEVHNCWLEIQQIKPCLAKDIIFLPHLFNIFVSYGETKVKTETNLKK